MCLEGEKRGWILWLAAVEEGRGIDQSEGCLCVATQPSLECARADSRREKVEMGVSTAVSR